MRLHSYSVLEVAQAQTGGYRLVRFQETLVQCRDLRIVIAATKRYTAVYFSKANREPDFVDNVQNRCHF